MKKLAISLLIGASLVITPSAFALKAMTASNMKDATGQAGVSIALDDVTIFQSVGETLYTDTDGLDGTDAASLVIGDKETLTTYRAIFDAGDRSGFLAREYGTFLTRTAENGGDIEIAALSIDVSGKIDTLSYGEAYNHRSSAKDSFDADPTSALGVAYSAAAADALAAAQAADPTVVALTADQEAAVSFAVMQGATRVAGVVIGLPTLEICKTADTYTVGIRATGSANSDKDFIQITKSASVMAVLGGTVEIAAH